MGKMLIDKKNSSASASDLFPESEWISRRVILGVQFQSTAGAPGRRWQQACFSRAGGMVQAQAQAATTAARGRGFLPVQGHGRLPGVGCAL